MPQFVTISPTHVPGKKEYAWNNFLNGNYIAIGWMNEDLSNKSIDEVIGIIQRYNFDDEKSAIDAFTKFLSLEKGDYVAVNKVNHGLFGVGKIKSGYNFELQKHDSGSENPDEYYPHYREVDWITTTYVYKKDLLENDEAGWQPYGTMGKIHHESPLYIRRLLGEKPETSTSTISFEIPDYLNPIVESINVLHKDPSHQERAHESIVEDFFVALGYEKHKDIKFQQGRMDISIRKGKIPLAIVEVKKRWDLNQYTSSDAIKQAYGYALTYGYRIIIVTNGDDYLIYDRIKGLSLNSNLIGQFKLSKLTDEDTKIIEKLRPDNLRNPNINEIFHYISESFKTE